MGHMISGDRKEKNNTSFFYLAVWQTQQ